MDNLLLAKLATLYGVMTQFNVVDLSKEHTLHFLNLIATTDTGKLLLQLCAKLKGKDEFSAGFLITTRVETNQLCLIYYVDDSNTLQPHIAALKATETYLASHNIKFEVDTIANATKKEYVQW